MILEPLVQTENCVGARQRQVYAKCEATGFFPPLRYIKMIWIAWALLLVIHGATARWTETRAHHVWPRVMGDVLLIAIAVVTLDQLMVLGLPDILRIGLFFVAFGYCGRQMMNSLLGRNSLKAPI